MKIRYYLTISIIVLLLLSCHANRKGKHHSKAPNNPAMEDTNKMKKVISKDGTSIIYWETGTGPPLLFVHGITADHNSWYKITPLLKDQFTVYAMDRRGRGGSGDSPGYDINREAEDIVAVVKSIGEPVFVFGQSSGALYSLEAALLTDKITKLILYESPLPGIAPTIEPGLPERINTLVQEGQLEEALELFYRDLVKMPEHELKAFQETPVWNLRVESAPTIYRELAIDNTYQFKAGRFEDLDIPVLLLTGSESPPFNRLVIDSLKPALSHSEVVILHGQQHMAHYEDPELLSKEIIEFLKK